MKERGGAEHLQSIAIFVCGPAVDRLCGTVQRMTERAPSSTRKVERGIAPKMLWQLLRNRSPMPNLCPAYDMLGQMTRSVRDQTSAGLVFI